MKIDKLDFSKYYISGNYKEFDIDDRNYLPHGFILLAELRKLLPELKILEVDKLISIFIKLFLKKYPNCYLEFFDFIGSSYQFTRIDPSHHVYDSIDIYNKDIDKVNWFAVKVEKFYDTEFKRIFYNIIFVEKIEFILKKEISESVIIDAIGDVKYTKNGQSGVTSFNLEDSALKSIEREEKKITLNINPDKFFYYGQ